MSILKTDLDTDKKQILYVILKSEKKLKRIRLFPGLFPKK
jgi:hypothetical protein